MRITFSWDDGALEDQKLFELHEKYKIPGIFFVPTRNREGRDVLTPEMIKNAESEYVQFGGHTENHVYLTELSLEEVETEIVNNKTYLENILGHEVRDFCFPGGRYNQQILDIVYRYYQTVRTADTMNLKYDGGPLKPTFHFYPRGIKSLIGNGMRHRSFREIGVVLANYNQDYFRLLNTVIDTEKNNPDAIISIWGHSWEIEELGLWKQLEELFDTISITNRDSIVFYNEIFVK
ncbi:MAG: polysaccharide deacetylase family protein [Lachnospiraceae bacterium]|nr:polysaccharide deacetylase family protein [Lachnospiraceae bacterium]